MAVAGLRTNDRIIATSRIGFAKLGKDTADESVSKMDLDIVTLEALVGSLVKNLERVDALLGDATHFPASATNDDEKKLQDLRKKLLAVADQQRASLNAINGTVETHALGALQHDHTNDQMGTALAQKAQHQSASVVHDIDGHISDAGLVQLPPGWSNPQLAADQLALHAGSYGPAILAIDALQEGIGRQEQSLTPDVIAAVDSCSGP